MEQPQAQMPAEKKEEPKPIFDESQLTEQERKMVNDFAAQIDLNNSNVILQYGAGAQKKMADFSESALENVRTKDLGEIGEMLSSVVTELKNFDEEEEKGFFGFFKKNANKLNSMKAKYAKAEANVNQIVEGLEKHMMTLLKDVAMLDKMYEINKTYEIMGMRNAMDFGAEMFNLCRINQVQEQSEFNRIVNEQGLKAAMAWKEANEGKK